MYRHNLKLNTTHIVVSAWICLIPILIYSLSSLEFLVQNSDGSGFFRADRYPLSFDFQVVISSFLIFLNLIVAFSISNNLSLSASPIVIFLILYSVLVHPGIVLYDGIINQEVARFSTNISLIGFLTGLLMCVFYKMNFNQIKHLSFKQNLASNSNFKISLWWVIIIFVVSWSLFLPATIRSLNFSTLIDFVTSGGISESAMDMRDIRGARYIHFGYFDVLLSYIQILIIPVCSLALIHFSNLNRRRVYFYLGVISLALIFVTAIGSGRRLMIGQLIIVILIWLALLGSFNIKRLVFFGVIGTIIMALVTATMGRMGDQGTFSSNLIGAAVRLLERVFLVKGSASAFVFDFYPSVFDFENGRSIMNRILGASASDDSLAARLFEYRYGFKGTAGPQSFPELYANWGFTGAFFGALFIAILLFIVSSYFADLKSKDPFVLALASYAIFSFSYMGYSDVAAAKGMGIHAVLVFATLYFVFRWIFHRVLK